MRRPLICGCLLTAAERARVAQSVGSSRKLAGGLVRLAVRAACLSAAVSLRRATGLSLACVMGSGASFVIQ